MAKKNTKNEPRLFAVATPRGLNLREAPDGKIITTLAPEDVVSAKAQESAAKWIKVKANTVSGWVMSDFLRPVDEPEVDADTDEGSGDEPEVDADADEGSGDEPEVDADADEGSGDGPEDTEPDSTEDDEM